MVKTCAFLTWALFVLSCGTSDRNVQSAGWEKAFGGDKDDFAYSLISAADGGYIIVGQTGSFGSGNADVYLIKTSAAGDRKGQATFGGRQNEHAKHIIRCPGGGFIVIGTTASYGGGGSDVYLLKIDSLGNLIWEKTFGGPGNDEGWSADKTADKGIIIVGAIFRPETGDKDVYLIKADTSGEMLWARTFGGAKDDFGYSVACTSDGGFIITGMTYSYGAGVSDVYLLKTNAEGDSVWAKTYGGYEYDRGNFVAQTFDNGYIIAGKTHSYGVNPGQIYLIKTDASGDTSWTRTFDCGNHGGQGHSVALTPDGGYVIAGNYGGQYNPQTQTLSSDVYLIKVDSLGKTIWKKTYGGYSEDYGFAVIHADDGGYIIAGNSYSFREDSEIYLLKTDENGDM